ncbi:SDR family NAD(P)-dependent oxidoreductase [Streptomyces muensis]|uniref:SDR family oxidoreductase n=1 Tax=Streptomyces muensis TaxID=1077944 RepID=A0A9X1PUJ9_STRM4|nr:SDR family oxidoreductase [Streptomyces muensis]MCF1592529.1 SDR family oxidoreductase [Streptomyces muensis]
MTRTVVVSGGGQGLGRAFALALAETGWQVAVADIDHANADRVAAEIVDAGGVAVGVEVDVASEPSVASAYEAVRERLGAVTGLVNNAALFSTLTMGPFEDIGLDTWERVMRVNVAGAFLMTRAFVPDMRANGYGKVVNITSATVFAGRPGYLHYVTSKAALVGMTRALAGELGPDGITVNAIAPGSTETEVERATISAGDRAAMANATALRRIQLPGDLVGALQFTLSPDSDFMTGQTLVVDGGLVFH